MYQNNLDFHSNNKLDNVYTEVQRLTVMKQRDKRQNNCNCVSES